MSKYDADRPRPEEARVSPVQVTEAISWEWMRAAHQTQMPTPCPKRADETAAWWLGHMTEAQRDDESEAHFISRSAYALRSFLKLDEGARKTVVSGVRDDGVPYRGEDFAFYVRVWDETVEMRKDRAGYRVKALQALRQALGGPAQPTVPSDPRRREEIQRELEEASS